MEQRLPECQEPVKLEENDVKIENNVNKQSKEINVADIFHGSKHSKANISESDDEGDCHTNHNVKLVDMDRFETCSLMLIQLDNSRDIHKEHKAHDNKESGQVMIERCIWREVIQLVCDV